MSDSPDTPAVDSPTGVIPLDSSGTVLAAVTYAGIPFGPHALWTLNKLEYGPAPFTASQNYISADTLILQINAARTKGHRLMLAMTGGLSTRYTTNGKFDMVKWKARMNAFNRSTLKTAVAAAVADGTLIGNLMIDEPETARWGNVLTKPMLDQMARDGALRQSRLRDLPIQSLHHLGEYRRLAGRRAGPGQARWGETIVEHQHPQWWEAGQGWVL